jgi:hypothetical protein
MLLAGSFKRFLCVASLGDVCLADGALVGTSPRKEAPLNDNQVRG